MGVKLDVWLYGPLSRYGGSEDNIAANVQVTLPAGSTVADLLGRLEMPTEERGFSFINGDVSAMPGLQPDLSHVLEDGDRVAFFHLKSMWPCQYRYGAQMAHEMESTVRRRDDLGLHTRFDTEG